MPDITWVVPQLSVAIVSWVKGNITDGGTAVGLLGFTLVSSSSQLLNSIITIRRKENIMDRFVFIRICILNYSVN